MRILLDECVHAGLKKIFPGHVVQTVPQAGWSGIKNGRLLALIAGKFDVFLTVDQNLQHQQNGESSFCYGVGGYVQQCHSSIFTVC